MRISFTHTVSLYNYCIVCPGLHIGYLPAKCSSPRHILDSCYSVTTSSWYRNVFFCMCRLAEHKIPEMAVRNQTRRPEPPIRRTLEMQRPLREIWIARNPGRLQVLLQVKDLTLSLMLSRLPALMTPQSHLVLKHCPKKKSLPCTGKRTELWHDTRQDFQRWESRMFDMICII